MAKQDELVFGIHSVTELLQRAPERFIEIWLLKGRDDDRVTPLLDMARKYGIAVQFVHRKTLDDKSDGQQHQGIIAKVKQGKQYSEADLDELIDHATEQQKIPLLLVLDGVTDPHNLGACLRNADAAGAIAVVVPKDNAAKLNATVRKVAVGAAETVPLVQVTNLARTLKALQQRGVWIIGTAGEAEQLIYQTTLSGPIALVMGAEDKGMRRLTREHCDELVKLPMLGSVSSLNVSVAAGVCLFEIVRQRLVSSNG